MSIFQCFSCGCAENTSYSSPCTLHASERGARSVFDWTGKEELIGHRLCSACLPTHYSSGEIARQLHKDTPYGTWHGNFTRRYLTKGMYMTDKEGNLVHKDTGLPPKLEDYHSVEQ